MAMTMKPVESSHSARSWSLVEDADKETGRHSIVCQVLWGGKIEGVLGTSRRTSNALLESHLRFLGGSIIVLRPEKNKQELIFQSGNSKKESYWDDFLHWEGPYVQRYRGKTGWCVQGIINYKYVSKRAEQMNIRDKVREKALGSY